SEHQVPRLRLGMTGRQCHSEDGALPSEVPAWVFVVMRLFAPSLAFVDLETTGTRAARDRITEIGIVRVDADTDGGVPQVTEWSSLVNPGIGVPAAIVALTGITDAMIAGAPSFAALVRDVAHLLSGCVFVAHNARFDYGFLKHEFARLERTFTARVLCTVKLSRRLFPDAQAHHLDALIERHHLAISDRHRALADARAIWAFVQTLYRDFHDDVVESAVKEALRIASLPAHLPHDALDELPEAPGVYLFYGENTLPLYIGKSVNIRDRVAAHFSGDWRSETDLRLSREIRRIEFEETAGELGALLREATLVKSLVPAHNRALRRKEEAGVLVLTDGGVPRYFPASARTDVHLFRNWCWLGTARDDGEFAALLDAPPRPQFDIDVARLLLKRWNRRSLALVDVTRKSTSPST